MSVFPPPVVPSELPECNAHPALKAFLSNQVDMQFADLRVLFRLPVDELDPHTGCNLTTASILLNVITGFSVWLFQTEEAARIEAAERSSGRRRSGERFNAFVATYWPQIPPEPSGEVVAKRLYAVRNSLAHDLGVDDDPRRPVAEEVKLAKHALPLEEIVKGLERNAVHPLTVPVIEERDSATIVHLAGVYWALHRMLRAALADKAAEIDTAMAKVVFPTVEDVEDAGERPSLQAPRPQADR